MECKRDAQAVASGCLQTGANLSGIPEVKVMFYGSQN